MSVQLMIDLGSTKFDPNEATWLDQVAALRESMLEAVGGPTLLGSAATGQRGTLETVAIALGSSGALTAAVACFRAWLSRDKTRSLTVSWTDVTGEIRQITVAGENLDEGSFKTLMESVPQLFGER
ncbi:hypothetical protein ACFQS3_09930 [Glycomyces mayteni]|uniref:Uncharacterized protein n=1 Tax=Glycomyces mayteni TaxID=543887 RepID=A0ABW2D8R2_9ACTN